ncbi:MAG TPA: histidine kinase, partial [Streptosporangiaceae bacterium]
WSRARDGVVAVGRCLVLCALTLAGIGPPLAVAVVVLLLADTVRTVAGEHGQGLYLTGHGLLPLLLIASSVLCLRLLTGLTRRLAGQWSGAAIGSPYRPLPHAAGLRLGQEVGQRVTWLLTDPASWRDLLWLSANACGICLLVVLPPALVAYGLTCIVAHGLTLAADAPLGHILVKGPGAIPVGLAIVVAGVAVAPRLLAVYWSAARLLLAPTRGSELASQVARLTQTRSQTLDASAAELRRIERDLHDGAQARLVAMGMALDAAGHLLDDDLASARALIREARDSSALALAELRDLVRGIHPPVLADRGMAEAIRALTLGMPLHVDYACDLADRPPAPVESAAYFAVSELLANVSKHADASRAWIDIRHEAGMLRIGISDDGRGGAEPARGTGLRGIERRLAAFDGVLALSSPAGGPTVVNLEIPCALSSPKTSSS